MKVLNVLSFLLAFALVAPVALAHIVGFWTAVACEEGWFVDDETCTSMQEWSIVRLYHDDIATGPPR